MAAILLRWSSLVAARHGLAPRCPCYTLSTGPGSVSPCLTHWLAKLLLKQEVSKHEDFRVFPCLEREMSETKSRQGNGSNFPHQSSVLLTQVCDAGQDCPFWRFAGWGSAKKGLFPARCWWPYLISTWTLGQGLGCLPVFCKTLGKTLPPLPVWGLACSWCLAA